MSWWDDFWGSVSDAVTSLADDVVNSINVVLNPIDAELTSLEDELGSTLTAGLQDAGALLNDVVAGTESLADDIGGAVSNLATEAETGLNDIVTVTTSAVQDYLVAPLKDLGSNVENGLSDFVRDYGHALVDAAADYMLPGSSILIDAAWTYATSGHVSLAGLAQDGVNAAMGELLPGVDEALAGALPTEFTDLYTGQLNSILTTYANDLAAGKPMSLAALTQTIERGIEQEGVAGGLEASLRDDALFGATQSLQSLIGGSDLTGSVTATQVQVAFTLVNANGTSPLTLLENAAGIAGLSPTEILALGGDQVKQIAVGIDVNGSLIDSAADILAAPTIDLLQGLALASAGMTLMTGSASTGAPTVVDTAAGLEALDAGALVKLRTVGVRVL